MTFMKKIFAIILFLKTFSGITQVNLTSSNLAIISITTKGAVADDPKIEGEMTVFWNDNGKDNSITDTKPNFKGKIGIEFRGSSSQIWPKKPYGIELWDDKKASVKAQIMGMPSESDWVLFASYNERSLMHNVLAQKIAAQMGLGGSKTRYCELILNGSYQGVYVFMEKIKQGKGRVDIANLTPTELSGDALTGGYIVKVDKTTGSGSTNGWVSDYQNFGTSNKTFFQYDYPKDIVSDQRKYIRTYIQTFEKALAGSDFLTKDKGYAQYIDMKSFAKYLLVNEISRNVDGYRISSYLYKDKDSKGGKLTAGPAWDFDLTFGNADYCDGWKTTGWAYDFNYVCPNDGFFVPFWYERMLKDPVFVQVLADEYKKLREGYMSDKTRTSAIDSLQNELKDAQVRNFTKWNRLGKYDWPIPSPIAVSWQGEVDQLKTWLADRLKWLDNNMPKSFVGFDPNGTLTTENTEVISTEVYPNPIIDRFLVKINTPQSEALRLELIDLSGKVLGHIESQTNAGENTIEVPADVVDNINSVSILRIVLKDKTIIKRLVKL
jgi:CotH kinase protein